MATKLSPVGAQFRVNGLTGNFQEFPDIVPLSDGRFVVVFEQFSEADGSDVDIHGSLVNADGTLSNTLFVTNPPGIQQNPAVAARGNGGFTTVWQDFGTTTGLPIADPNIYFAINSSAGSTIVNRTLLMGIDAPLEDPDIASMSDGRQIVSRRIGPQLNRSRYFIRCPGRRRSNPARWGHLA
jgi:hypothetical protein